MVDSQLADLSDEALVDRAQARGARDERPFTELFRRHRTSIWQTCYRYLNNPQDVEDIMQEVFFKAYRNLGQFEGRSSFKTWLHQIAINTSLNEIRRRGRRPQESQTPLEDLADLLPAEDLPELSSAVLARREHLAQALAALRPAERETLQLVDLEGRSYAEVAQILDISLSAAKMRIQRARLALQAAYREQEPS